MLKVFLSTHAHLASGFKSSSEIFMAQLPNVTVYDAYVDGDDSTLSERLESFYSAVDDTDEVLLLSDIYGGSVNTEMCKFLSRPNTRLVTGINLPFLLEVVAETHLTDEKLDEMIQTGRSFLRRVDLDACEADGLVAANTDEDFF